MAVEDVVELLAIKLIGVVPDDEKIVISTNQGEPLVGSNTPAGKAYMNVCYRIMGEEVEFEDFSKNGVFSKIAGIFKKN